jgi:uncharacterized protein YecT (DUF1311 family)
MECSLKRVGAEREADLFRRFALALAALICLPDAGARAFDCSNAATPSEKAICADPAALKADAAMSEAFSALLAGASSSERAQIEATQSRWLQTRDYGCEGAAGAELGACLMRESDERRSFLLGQPEAGPGTSGRIAPTFRFEKGGHGRAALDLELLKFVDPDTDAARAFNAAVEKATGDIVEPEKGEPQDDKYEYDWSMRLTYASPRLISARLDGFSCTAGAHPNTVSHNINIDVAAGREARFEDAFAPESTEKIFALCDQSLREQKKQRLGDEAPKGVDELATLAKEIRDATRDLGAWSFAADKATVVYDRYAVGAYYEGAYACEIRYVQLREWAKPGFPLP